MNVNAAKGGVILILEGGNVSLENSGHQLMCTRLFTIKLRWFTIKIHLN